MRQLIGGLLLSLWGTITLVFVLSYWDWNASIKYSLGLVKGLTLLCVGLRFLWSRSKGATAAADSMTIHGTDAKENWWYRSFPRWWAPFAGLLLGAGIGLQIGVQEGGLYDWLALPFAAGIGLFAGCIIALLDPAPRQRVEQFDPRGWSTEGNPYVATASPMESAGSRALAVLSLLVCWAPVVGLGMSITAVLANQNCQGWAMKMSWAAAILSLLSTGALAALAILALLV